MIRPVGNEKQTIAAAGINLTSLTSGSRPATGTVALTDQFDPNLLTRSLVELLGAAVRGGVD